MRSPLHQHRASRADVAEVLAPFAAVADEYDDAEDDEYEVWKDAGPWKVVRASFTLKHFRAARAAIRQRAQAVAAPAVCPSCNGLGRLVGGVECRQCEGDGQAVAAPAASPWQPVEIAPRAKKVLVRCGPTMDVAYLTDNEPPLMNTWRYAGSSERGRQLDYWPTEWASLPPQPEGARPQPHGEGLGGMERGYIKCGPRLPSIRLWLMLLDENDTALKLSSDDAEAWIRKDSCVRLPNGQFEMSEAIAVGCWPGKRRVMTATPSQQLADARDVSGWSCEDQPLRGKELPATHTAATAAK